MQWLADRKAKWRAEIDQKVSKNVTKGSGKWAGLTGREIFMADSSVFVDDAGAPDDLTYEGEGQGSSSGAAVASSGAASSATTTATGATTADVVDAVAEKVDASLYLQEEDEDLDDLSDEDDVE